MSDETENKPSPSWYRNGQTSESKFESCAEDDPLRCQASIKLGQCHYKAVPNSKYCIRHGGAATQKKEQKEELSNYRLSVWKQQLEEKRNNPNIKSLRDEVGIARIVLQEILEKCKTGHDLIMHHGPINNSVVVIEKLINSCQRLEERNSLLMDKDQLVFIMDSISQIISLHISDPDILNQIGEQIYGTIAQSATRKAEE